MFGCEKATTEGSENKQMSIWCPLKKQNVFYEFLTGQIFRSDKNITS